jgi:hypothetical protein
VRSRRTWLFSATRTRGKKKIPKIFSRYIRTSITEVTNIFHSPGSRVIRRRYGRRKKPFRLVQSTSRKN